MSFTKDAYLIYVYARDLDKINRQLSQLNKKADLFQQNYLQSKEETKIKYALKHHKLIQKIKQLTKTQGEIFRKIEYHHSTFLTALKKEQK